MGRVPPFQDVRTCRMSNSPGVLVFVDHDNDYELDPTIRRLSHPDNHGLTYA